jgi:hypothetical protein
MAFIGCRSKYKGVESWAARGRRWGLERMMGEAT